MEIAMTPRADYADDNQDVFDLLANIRTGDHLDALDLPPMSWQVFGLIPEGMGLLTGPPKVGKSWLVLDIALAVAAGATVLGVIDTGPPRPVLYLALEDGERRLQSRARKLLDDTPIPAGFHYLTTANPALILPTIRGWLAIHGHRKPLVILDTLGKVMPPAKPGESAYSRDYRIGGELKDLADEHPGSTLLLVHHIRKMEATDWMDSTSGTNGLNGSSDFTLNVHRPRNETAGLLRITGRDIKFEAEYAATFNDCSWTLDGNDLREASEKGQQARTTANLGDRSAEIIEWVNSQDEPVTAGQVDNALGTKDVARTYLGRLEKAGRLRRVARGTYTSVASVPSVASELFDSPDATHATHATPTTRCTVCNFPLPDSVTADGFTTHPGCAA